MKIAKDIIEALRKLNIEIVADRLGIMVKGHLALCVFHNENNPSLHFNVAKGTFHCYSCGAHGGVIDLAMHVLGCNFTDACKWLADESNVIIEDSSKLLTHNSQMYYPPDTEFLENLVRHPVLTAEAKHFLFDVRHLDPNVIAWCGISSISESMPCYRWGKKPFYEAPALLYPYRDVSGKKVLNVQSRFLGLKGAAPRFRFPSNSTTHIFNMPILRYLKSGEPLYVAEGITDCLAMCSNHMKAIAIPSATMLKPKDLEMLRGHELIIFPDNDEAGDKLYNGLTKAGNDLGLCVVKEQLPMDCKDFSEYYLKYIKGTSCAHA